MMWPMQVRCQINNIPTVVNLGEKSPWGLGRIV